MGWGRVEGGGGGGAGWVVTGHGYPARVTHNTAHSPTMRMMRQAANKPTRVSML